MIFIVDGAEPVIPFVMRSRASWIVFVPLDNTSIGVQFLAAPRELFLALKLVTLRHWSSHQPSGWEGGHLCRLRCSTTLLRNGKVWREQ